MSGWAYCLPSLSRGFPTCKVGVKAAAHRVDVKAPCDESGAQMEPGKGSSGRVPVSSCHHRRHCRYCWAQAALLGPFRPRGRSLCVLPRDSGWVSVPEGDQRGWRGSCLLKVPLLRHLPSSGVRAGPGPRRRGCHSGLACACECARVCQDVCGLTQSCCRARRGPGSALPRAHSGCI